MMTKLVARASLGLCSGPSGQGFDSLVVRLTIVWNISYIMHLTKIFIQPNIQDRAGLERWFPGR